MSLLEIIIEDAKHLYRFSKGVIVGTFRGTYTPYLMTTSARQHSKLTKDRMAGERIGHYIGYVGSHVLLNIPILYLAISEGKGKHYITAILATNTFDYLYNLKDRHKKSYRCDDDENI